MQIVGAWRKTRAIIYIPVTCSNFNTMPTLEESKEVRRFSASYVRFWQNYTSDKLLIPSVPTSVRSLLRDTCGASDELVALLMNTTYDEVEENEGTWSDFAETYEISQMDYKLVVRQILERTHCIKYSVTVDSVCHAHHFSFQNTKVSFAFIASLAVTAYLVIITVPSYVSQVLRFRAGTIRSLDDPEFLRLRFALDTSTMLFASSFWGVSGTVGLCLSCYVRRVTKIIQLLESILYASLREQCLYTSLAAGVVCGGIVSH